MEKISIPAFTFAAKNYCLLTKPGIIMGNVITMAGGFALASRGHIHFWQFIATLIGLSFVIASACVCNNYIDREMDEKMTRTKNRALVKGLISEQNALLFAIFLGLLGIFFLGFFTNLLTLLIALFGFVVYVVLYSFSKYRSMHGTLIGSVAGAIPPVVGYCSVSNRLDLGALIVFTMVVMWQMPHFFSIAIYRLKEYSAASIPVLPIQKGMRTTKIHMMLYILAFITASFMLTVFGFTGYTYLIIAALLGFTWLGLCMKGFKCDNEEAWARKMFFFSLVVITTLSIAIPFTVIP
ncbi:MAG: Protoheme IX farnesyltransferase [Chlamydiae bacterium]|nr:Protoheme IX farnesyltransferase [Chlamydiota bacterium]